MIHVLQLREATSHSPQANFSVLTDEVNGSHLGLDFEPTDTKHLEG